MNADLTLRYNHGLNNDTYKLAQTIKLDDHEYRVIGIGYAEDRIAIEIHLEKRKKFG